MPSKVSKLIGNGVLAIGRHETRSERRAGFHPDGRRIDRRKHVCHDALQFPRVEPDRAYQNANFVGL